MDSALLIQTCFAIIGALLSLIGLEVIKSLRRMAQSIETLNERVAVVIEKTESHDKRISRLESKI